MRTIVYVDGFNVYYGLRHYAACKWLDLHALAQKMLPRDNIVAIKYFTAQVDNRPHNPGTQQRQETYLRALRTIPILTPYFGRFLTTQIPARLVNPRRGRNPIVTVWKTEEKGSDVNLAMHLLVDGFNSDYELAAVMSNDGDLKAPIEYVRNRLHLPVGVLNPRSNRSYALSPPHLPPGSFYKPIRQGAFAASQFPATMTDSQGTFSKPSSW